MTGSVPQRSNLAAPWLRSRTASSRNGSEVSVPHRGNVTARVRTIGLVSSVIVLAAIGLTLLVDNGHEAFGERVSRSELIFLLILAVAVFYRSLPIAIGVSLPHQGPRPRNNQVT